MNVPVRTLCVNANMGEANQRPAAGNIGRKYAIHSEAHQRSAHAWRPGLGDAVTANLAFVLNGPNLNLLGKRQPEIYGCATLADVESLCRSTGAELDLAIAFKQSNAEHELIGWIHEARERAAGIVINPAGFSHTSIAIMDALAACSCPIIEVHITNIHRREPFRHHSQVSRVAAGVICGCGIEGYALALRGLATLLEKAPT
jgi:3-dehydroquinate dehydratase-2